MKIYVRKLEKIWTPIESVIARMLTLLRAFSVSRSLEIILNIIWIHLYLATPRYFDSPRENPLLFRLNVAKYSSLDTFSISSISVLYVCICIIHTKQIILHKLQQCCFTSIDQSNKLHKYA